MFAIVGIAGGVFLIAAIIGVLYMAGNRGRKENVANQEAAADGRPSWTP